MKGNVKQFRLSGLLVFFSVFFYRHYLQQTAL